MDSKKEIELIDQAIANLAHARRFAVAGVTIMKALHLIGAVQSLAQIVHTQRVDAGAMTTKPDSQLLH